MTCGLVLAGGGARGAYEIGALAELLPVLEERGEPMEVIVGTSIGAVNAGYLAANAHRPVQQVVDDGVARWQALRLKQIIASPWAPRGIGRLVRYLLQVAGVPGVQLDAILNPSPIKRTLRGLVDVGQIASNIDAGELQVAAVAATSNRSGLSVVFHHGGQSPREDRARGIEYVPVRLEDDHIRASAALPVLFPAVEVNEPPSAKGWYFDGGTRLNTAIRPALALGAKRIVIVGPNAILAREQEELAGGRRPDVFEGASHVLQGLFADPVAQDVRELGAYNAFAMASPRGRHADAIPYIFVAPQKRNEIGEQAAEVFRDRYATFRGFFRAPRLSALGRTLGGGADPIHGELLSYIFFAREFADRLIKMGRRDARCWLAREHDDGPWRTRPLADDR
jgi:NTE family protein